MELKGHSVVPTKNFGLPLRLGMRASIKMVISSPYLMMIFAIVVSYSFSINLIEGIWMFKANQFYQDTASLMRYHAKISFCTGLLTLLCAICGGYVIRRFGWLRAALLTPLMILFAGFAFFVCILIHEGMQGFALKFGFSALGVLVFIGGIQNILSKGVKYSIFDTTKEMLYIPLNPEFKTKGKAAVEVIGPKVGKAFGSGLQAAIFFLFPRVTYDDISLMLVVIFVLVLLFWLYSVRAIHASYSTVVSNES
jgi:ATP/ADP translocase